MTHDYRAGCDGTVAVAVAEDVVNGVAISCHPTMIP